MVDTEQSSPERDLGTAPGGEPSRPARSATLAMIETVEYAVVNMPWRAFTALAWGWAIYQAIRILSLVQDIVVEHVRMFDRQMADAADRVVLMAVAGVGCGVGFGIFLVLFCALCLVVAHGIRAGLWTWRWRRSRRSAP